MIYEVCDRDTDKDETWQKGMKPCQIVQYTYWIVSLELSPRYYNTK